MLVPPLLCGGECKSFPKVSLLVLSWSCHGMCHMVLNMLLLLEPRVLRLPAPLWDFYTAQLKVQCHHPEEGPSECCSLMLHSALECKMKNESGRTGKLHSHGKQFSMTLWRICIRVSNGLYVNINVGQCDAGVSLKSQVAVEYMTNCGG